jgi:hypothetical protein
MRPKPPSYGSASLGFPPSVLLEPLFESPSQAPAVVTASALEIQNGRRHVEAVHDGRASAPSPTEHSSSSCCPTLDPGLVSRDGPRRLPRQSGSSCTPVRGPALGETSMTAPGSTLLIVCCESLRGSGSGCPHLSRSETCSLRRLAALSRPAAALWLSSPRPDASGVVL